MKVRKEFVFYSFVLIITFLVLLHRQSHCSSEKKVRLPYNCFSCEFLTGTVPEDINLITIIFFRFCSLHQFLEISKYFLFSNLIQIINQFLNELNVGFQFDWLIVCCNQIVSFLSILTSINIISYFLEI